MPKPKGRGTRLRFPGVRAPKPLLSAEAERQLGARQLELLDELEEKLRAEGLADLTMAEIAAFLGCSLRTLYGIAPGKDELLLTVVDRRLHRIGRAAIEALRASMRPLDALREYLQSANEAVQPEVLALSAHLVKVRGAERVISAHEDYVIAVTQNLLDRAIDSRRCLRSQVRPGGLRIPFVNRRSRSSPARARPRSLEIVSRGP
jgi:AcrR family transcriptional regulator